MANWVYPVAQEITGTTKIKEADNKIQAAMDDLNDWANNTGAYSPNLGASFNYTTVSAMTDVLLTSIAVNDGLRWNGTDFVNTPMYNRSELYNRTEQDNRYIQLTGNQTVAGVKTFSNGIVSSVTGNVTGNVTGDITGNITGSSGSCTGNSATSTKLATARTISLAGDISGSASFDGSSNISITAAVADDSHNHNTLTGLSASIAELNYTDGVTSNIQTQINTANSSIASLSTSKADLASPTLSGTPLAPTASVSTDNTQIATTAFVRDIIPAGIISMWSGSIASIPSGWALCNGTNGTPNLVDRFVICAGSAYNVGATGGSKDAIVVSHSHTITSTATALSSTARIDLANPFNADGTRFTYSELGNRPGLDWASGSQSRVSLNLDHNHAISSSASTTGSSGTDANLPPYLALAYIMKL